MHIYKSLLMLSMSTFSFQVWCCAISSDNELIVSGSRDGAIRLWRMRTGNPVCCYNTGIDIFKLKISSDSRTIVALGDREAARKLIMLQIVRRRSRSQGPSRATSPYASDASRPISPYQPHQQQHRERFPSSSSYASDHVSRSRYK